MKRPDKEIGAMEGPWTIAVMEYLAYLEGWIAATKETIASLNTGHRKEVKPKAKPEYANLCAGCRFSTKIPAPEKSDIKNLIVCDEPFYGKHQNLIQQARQLGPCGPEALLREDRTNQPTEG